MIIIVFYSLPRVSSIFLINLEIVKEGLEAHGRKNIPAGIWKIRIAIL